MTDEQCAANTDRELYRDPTADGTENGSYYMPSLHVTITNRIGINVGGLVFEKTLTEWHDLAVEAAGGREALNRAMRPHE